MSITLEKQTRPPKVDDMYRYWSAPPPEMSERCRYWLGRINAGWRPNRRIRVGMGFEDSASWYGVYLWEMRNVIYPAVNPNAD